MKNDTERTMPTPSGAAVPIKRTASFFSSNWLVPIGLIALTFIPVLAGVIRLVSLAGGGPVTADNARFFAMPLPVIIHIIGATLFCVLGAFQFVPGLRRPRSRWHRITGRILIPCGIAAALSGLWMTVYYPLSPHLQGEFLYGFRILISSFMAVSIVLSFSAILRRNVAQHRAWIMRGYAVAQGAGTQALISILWLVFLGTPNEVVRDMLLIAGWIINLAVAEWIIRTGAYNKQHKPLKAGSVPFSASSQ